MASPKTRRSKTTHVNKIEADLSRSKLIATISGSSNSTEIVQAACALAKASGSDWDAVHVETPGKEVSESALEALTLAAKMGATISTIAAANVADGLRAYVRDTRAGHVVLGAGRSTLINRLRNNSVAGKLLDGEEDLFLHVHPRKSGYEAAKPSASATQPGIPTHLHYLIAVALVLATLAIAEGLQYFLGPRPLDLLFLFPVVAIATRFGVGPALMGIVLSVVLYNFFLLEPSFSFNALAPQNLVMAGVFTAIALYTGLLTANMRSRVLLSDRSARENAQIAALAQRLTHDADWESTAFTICEHVGALFNVSAILYREVEEKLTIAGALPADSAITPVDQAALDWSWSGGEESGAGTAMLAASNWQFQPLCTSLGMLGVLGLARADGRNPIEVHQKILLQTIVSQASLALERLTLEARIAND